LLHRRVRVVKMAQGVRAMVKRQLIDPASVKRYVEQKFGSGLADVQAAMEALAKAYTPDQLAPQAYALYEQFSLHVSEGKQGWGDAGPLDLDRIRSLGEER